MLCKQLLAPVSPWMELEQTLSESMAYNSSNFGEPFPYRMALQAQLPFSPAPRLSTHQEKETSNRLWGFPLAFCQLDEEQSCSQVQVRGSGRSLGLHSALGFLGWKSRHTHCPLQRPQSTQQYPRSIMLQCCRNTESTVSMLRASHPLIHRRQGEGLQSQPCPRPTAGAMQGFLQSWLGPFLPSGFPLPHFQDSLVSLLNYF